MEKLLVCDSCVIKHNEDSKLEMTLTKCKTSADELTSLLEKYMKETKQQGIVYDVNVSPFSADKHTVFGRNTFLPSKKDCIYFFGDVRKNSVVFTFDQGNKTVQYLLGFYFNYAINKN